MPVNRDLFKQSFTLDKVPDWICPTCEKGILRMKKGSFLQEESTYSQNNSHHPSYGYIYFEVEYVYICLFICSNDRCKEVVANTGLGFVVEDVELDEDGEVNEVDGDFFTPLYFRPPLTLIRIPKECPKTIKKSLQESFELFFSSPSSAANNLRISLEEILTDLKVKRFTISKKRERKSLQLHQRIGLLPDRYSNIKEMIEAIKWLGNAGSHSHDEVKVDHVLDAYELMEHVLEEIYQPKAKKLESIARKVNKKKGPT
jgi:hypothetical protein